MKRYFKMAHRWFWLAAQSSFIVLPLLFITNCVIAQTSIPPGPAIQWQRAIGGTLDDMVLTIKQTTDEGFIIGGVTASKDGDITNAKGKGDLFVVKLDQQGRISFKKTLGGPSEEQGCIVLQTTDGGYIVGGNTTSSNGDVKGFHGGDKDIWIVKLKPDLAIEWQKPLGGAGTDEIVSLKLTPDGGFLIGGNTNSKDGDVKNQHGDFDIWLVKLSGTGNLQWQRCYGSSGTEKIRDLQPALNGTFVFAGFTKNGENGDVTGYHDSTDVWIGRIDPAAAGNLLWQTCLGGSRNEHDFCIMIKSTDDGGFVVGTSTSSKDGNVIGLVAAYGTWIVKFDVFNTLQWQYIIQGGNIVKTIVKTSDNGVIISTSNLDKQYYAGGGTVFVKISGAGELVWTNEIMAPGNPNPYLMEATADGGCIISGSTSAATVPYYHESGDLWLAKIDGSGSMLWQRAYGGNRSEILQPGTYYTGIYFPINTSNNSPWGAYTEIIKAKDGGYFLAAVTSSTDGDVSGFHYSSKNGYKWDIWVVKITADSPPLTMNTSTINKTEIKEEVVLNHALSYPNPFTTSTTIRFTALETGQARINLYNILGAEVYKVYSNFVNEGQTYSIQLQDKKLAKGAYFYVIQNGNRKMLGQLLKQ